MLPRADNRTLSRYLLSVAHSIHLQVNGGFPREAAARLRECATIIARVAQQLEDSGSGDWSPEEEARALKAANRTFDRDEAARASAGRTHADGQRHIEAEQVQTYLRAHPLGGPEVEISRATLLPGGRCKLTAVIEQVGAIDLPACFILRQDWQGGATDTTVAEEYTLLQAVSAGGICAPRPLLLEAGQSIVGAPFILVERIPGEQVGSLFTPPASAPLARALAEQLGRLHALPAEQFGDPADTLARRADTLAAEFKGFQQSQEAIGLRSRIVDGALGWLGDNLAHAGTAVTLTHNDVGFHNCLVQGGELTGVLDWELARLGHPAEDLGYVSAFVPRMLPWAEFVQVYERAGGQIITPQELKFYTIWSGMRLYGLIMQARAALAADLVNDVEIAFACADNTLLLLEHIGVILDAQSIETRRQG